MWYQCQFTEVLEGKLFSEFSMDRRGPEIKLGKKDNLSFWLLLRGNLLTFMNVKTDLHHEKKFSEIPTIHLQMRHTSKKNVRFCSTVNGMLDCKKICVNDLLFVPPIVWCISSCWTKIVIFYLCHRLHSRRYKLFYYCLDRFCGFFIGS